MTGPVQRPADASDDLPCLDVSTLDEVFEGDVVMYGEVVDMFLAQGDGLVARIASAAEAGDRGAVLRAAHELKGSAASVGATRATEVSHQLCTMARTGSLDEAPALLSRIRAAMASTAASYHEGSAGTPGAGSTDGPA